MVTSSIVVPAVDDLVTSFDVFPRHPMTTMWVEGADGVPLGGTQLSRLVVVSLLVLAR